MGPLVSVIIPTYNSGSYLIDAVESVLNQDYPNLEIIIVDDGSNDGSTLLLESYNYKIQILHSENLGAASARNIGILVAKGEFIAFLDSDDKWAHNKITLQIKKLIIDKLDLVYCGGQEFTGASVPGKIHLPMFEGFCYPFYKMYPSRDIVAIGPSGVLLRKSLLHQTGIFDTNIPAPSEDWDFFRRYSRNGKFGYCSEVLVYRRMHSNNISRKSTHGYYLGNRNALLKMFLEDPSIRKFEKRVIWSKFHYISAKAFAKNGFIIKCLRSSCQIIFPTYS